MTTGTTGTRPTWQRARLLRTPKSGWPPKDARIWVEVGPPKIKRGVRLTDHYTLVTTSGFRTNLVPPRRVWARIRKRLKVKAGTRLQVRLVSRLVELLPQFRTDDPPFITWGDTTALRAQQEDYGDPHRCG